MKTINLTQNKVAFVDDNDYPILSLHRWHAEKQCNYYYASRKISLGKGKSRVLYMHRQIMNAGKGEMIDHINHNGLDNRRSNLRFCTQTQNNGNCVSRTGISRYKGVTWNKQRKKWQVQISYNNIRKYLGLFEDEIDAAKAYDSAALRFFGIFAYINLPNQLAL